MPRDTTCYDDVDGWKQYKKTGPIARAKNKQVLSPQQGRTIHRSKVTDKYIITGNQMNQNSS